MCVAARLSRQEKMMILSETAESILRRWIAAREEGDEQFTEDGIESVRRVLERFEADAHVAKNNDDSILRVLSKTVWDLGVLGGSDGRYGCFIETDEREELVPYLLGVVRDCGLTLEESEDPTESYRRW